MILLPLKEMSRAEKVIAMEALWADLSQNEAAFESPAWHQEELGATEQRVKSGKEQPIDWEQAKQQLRKQ
jgi:hypothetical protein